MLSITYEEKSKGKDKEIESEEDCSVTSNRVDVKKLQDAEVFIYNGFMLPTKKRLPGIKRLCEAQFDKICEEAEKTVTKTIFQITSGSEAPDELFAVSSNGINAGDVKKLLDAGIFTCNGLMMYTKKSLTEIKGLSEAKVDNICEAAEKIVNFGYFTGREALLKMWKHRAFSHIMLHDTVTIRRMKPKDEEFDDEVVAVKLKNDQLVAVKN